jgi:hypothetical protein
MTKADERIALDALNRLIDDQLQACAEPYKEEWVERTRKDFFKSDAAGNIVGVMIEGSQYVMPNDKWFAFFAAFRKIEYIHLDWCGGNITGRGFRSIAQLKRLKALNLWTCAIKDSVLVHLLPLRSLEWLRLCETRITNKGLKTIAQLPRLRGLELFSTKITDRGLMHLQGCRGLEYLDLNATEVTEAGIKELARYLPDCRISAAAIG